MSPRSVLERCQRAGIDLSVRDGELHVAFPGAIQNWMLDDINDNRLGLIAMLTPHKQNAAPNFAQVISFYERFADD